MLTNILLVLSFVACTLAGYSTWPGDNNVVTVDEKNYFDENLSGLYYVPSGNLTTDFMFAIMNNPPLLYKLAWNGDVWTSVTCMLIYYLFIYVVFDDSII